MSEQEKLADYVDRLHCMAREKRLQLEGPFTVREDLRESTAKDAEALDAAAMMVSGLLNGMRR